MNTYTEGDKITIESDKWVVRDVYNRDGARVVIGLVDQANPNHGTAFSADVLDQMIADGHATRRTTTSSDLTTQALHAFGEAIRAERSWANPELTGSAEEAWDAALNAKQAIRELGRELDQAEAAKAKAAAVRKFAAPYIRRGAEIRAAVEGYDKGLYLDKLQAFDAIRAIVEGGVAQ